MILTAKQPIETVYTHLIFGQKYPKLAVLLYAPVVWSYYTWYWVKVPIYSSSRDSYDPLKLFLSLDMEGWVSLRFQF